MISQLSAELVEPLSERVAAPRSGDDEDVRFVPRRREHLMADRIEASPGPCGKRLLGDPREASVQVELEAEELLRFEEEERGLAAFRFPARAMERLHVEIGAVTRARSLDGDERGGGDEPPRSIAARARPGRSIARSAIRAVASATAGKIGRT